MTRLKTCLWVLTFISAPAAADPIGGTTGAAKVAAVFGTITSTFRTVEHNRAVGGVPNSYHLLGRAIDVVRRRGVTHRQIDAALRAAGYSLIESLDEGDHSHFAFGSPVVVQRTAINITAAAAAPPPSVPAPPKLRADEHGTLWLDLKSSNALTIPALPPSGGRSAASVGGGG